MLRLYWKNATESVVGWEHGATDQDLKEIEPAITAAHDSFLRQIGDPTTLAKRNLGYVKLPEHGRYAAEVKKLARKLAPETTDLVVLGIGGSALGNIALQTALNPSTYNLLSDKKRGGPRLFVLDNVDPDLVGDVLDYVRPRLKTTIINVVSKSGETAETAAQFMIYREVLRKKLGKDFGKQMVVTTDVAKGTMHKIATEIEQYKHVLEVPPDVGGRFTVLAQVGLFSAAMCGIDIDALLAGAAEMKHRVETPLNEQPWRKNPACVLAVVKYLAMTRKHKPMHVMMPYSNRLYSLADWYRQLWAESLGKRYTLDGKEVFVGPTPIKALGTTDQHSQVQLYREGPNDKLTVFLEVARHGCEVKIPELFQELPDTAYLAGSTLGKLLYAEKVATEYAMAKSSRPTVTIKFDEITPETVGEFIYLYEFTTSLMGELLNIDAYDQPAVQMGKKATFALMGRPGYEQMASETEPFLRTDENYLV
jgi:glucose-6-phosphate isomerase